MPNNDRRRRQYLGTNYALVSELGGAGDHIVPLDGDEHAESAAITSYPSGISIMPVSGGANWNGNGEAASVITERTANSGVQRIEYASGWEEVRWWEIDASPAWGPWEGFAFWGHTHTNVVPLATDAHAESAAITTYPEGVSIMPTSATAGGDGLGWHDENVECVVTTHRSGSTGWQYIYFNDVAEHAYRSWNPFAPGWTQTFFYLSYEYYTANPPDTLDLRPVGSLTESSAITSFQEGLTVIQVSSGANWGPNAGEAGRLVTYRSDTTGTQEFHTDNGKMFFRAYSGGAWGTWKEINAWADISGKPSTFAPSTREWQAVFYDPDLSQLTIPASSGPYKVPNSGSPTITEITIQCETRPTGADILADVNTVNNTTGAKTTLYSTQANRPKITANALYSYVATLPDTVALSQGALINVDWDQRGSTESGKKVSVTIRGTY